MAPYKNSHGRRLIAVAVMVSVIVLAVFGWLRLRSSQLPGGTPGGEAASQEPSAKAGQPTPADTSADTKGSAASVRKADGKHGERKEKLANLDTRATGAEAGNEKRLKALAALRQKVQGVGVQFDPVTGAPNHVMSAGRFLRGPEAQAGDPYAAVRNFVNENADLFGHDATALNDSRITREDVTAHNGMRTVVWQQQVDGIPVYNTILKANLTKDGALVTLGSHFMGDALAATGMNAQERAGLVAQPPVDVRKAVSLAAANLGDAVAPEEAQEASEPRGAERVQRFSAPKLSDTFAQLSWLPVSANSAKLTWDVTLMSLKQNEMFRVVVDARSGEVLMRSSLTNDVSDATFRVYADATTKKPFDSPNPMLPGTATPSGAQASEVPRQLITLQSVNPTASPNGWINDGVFETLGNNVDAHTDTDANNVADLPRPTSATRIFDFPMDLTQAPSTYKDAAVVHLFYMCNWMHDQLYTLGFTETAGNFQTNNFGRGGLGNDPVQADAQDGSGTNNANMSTPTDGSSPRMQMYVFTGPTPDRDGDFDNVVLLHEYTHGLSNRLVGGGVGISATATGGMGEGWSDFYGLALLADPASDPNAVYPGGSYATLNFVTGMTTNYYYGIRRYPYSTDMTKNPLTFRDIDPTQASPHTGIPLSPLFGSSNSNPSEVHNVGEVWCMTLWECRANLIAKLGPSGAQMILQLVTDGMKLSPVNPNLLQARDAIIQADLVANGGANKNELWAAFAKRGMGSSATAPASSTTTGVVEAFDIPDALGVTPATGLTSSGQIGGPFTPASQAYTLTNNGASSLSWSAATNQAWLSVSPASGTLAVGASVTVTASLTATANALTAGAYSGTTTFTDANTGANIVRQASLTVTPPRIYYFDLATDPGWTKQGEWAFGTPTGGGGLSHGFHDPTSGATGTNVFGTNLSGDYSTTIGGPYYLTTGAINLTSYGGTQLRFKRWLNSDYPPYVTANVQVSNDGTNWTTVFANASGTEIADTAWTSVQYDISAVADNRSTVYIRWGHQVGSSGAFAYSGWNIDDVEILGTPLTALTISLSPGSATEGSAPVTATLGISPMPTVATVVTLASSDTNSATVPATVTIPSGQSSVTFPVTIGNDALLNGTRNVTLTAASSGYTSGTATLVVNDNEAATLAVSAPASVSEGAGTATGTLSVSPTPASAVTVTMTSSDISALTVPSTVTIPAGQTSVNFTMTVVNDSKINGTHPATITAHVANWTDGTATVNILDNENTNLTVSLPASVTEGGTGTGTVSISGTLTSALPVTLTSNTTSRLTVPATVSIPAGSTSVTFTVTAPDNTLTDGTATVNVAASAAGFTGTSGNVPVLDNDVHHFAVSTIASPQTKGVAFSATLAAKDVNGVTITSYTGTPTLSAAGTGGADSISPTATTAFAAGVWTGNVTVNTFDSNVVLTVSDGAGHTGSSNAFNVSVGALHHFAWNTIASPQNINVPFSTTITAKDAGNNTVTSFNGTAGLAGFAGGSVSTVQVLSFTLYSDNSATGEYLHTKQAISTYFTSYAETSTTVTDPTALASALVGKHVFLVPEQETATQAQLSALGTSWGPTLTNFVNSGGIVIVCSDANYEHLILANGGLMNVSKVSETSSTSLTKTATTVLNTGVTTPFAGSWISRYSSSDGIVSLQDATTSNPVVLHKDSGLGHVVLIGTDYFTLGTGTDRIVANAVAWAQSSGAPIPVSPTTTAAFTNGVWTGNVTVQQAANPGFLRASDGAGHTGDSNNFAVLGTLNGNPQSVTVPFGTATAITLTGQDTANPGATLAYSIVASPTHGTLSGTAPNVTYTPTAGYQGADSFTFKVQNGATSSPAATISITVTPGTPTATPQSANVAFNTAQAFTLSGTDPNVPALTLTYAIATQPAHGTVTGTAPNVTYTPATGHHGADSFTFTASNGTNTSAPAAVSITVATGTPVADAQTVSTTVNTPKAVTLGGSDPDVPPLPLTFAIVSGTAHGTLTGTAPNLVYTPTSGYNGPDSFTYSASNGTITSAPATVVISVGNPLIVESMFPVPSTTAGSFPKAPLVQGSDGNFYGTTSTGGSSNLGTVFKVTPAGVLTTLVNFYGANGATPLGGLTLASDGNFYGTTSGGGNSNLGTIFKLTSGGTFITLVHCTSTTGTVPKAALLQASDGNFYGTTSAGGTSGGGTIFKMTTAGTLTVLVNFFGSIAAPYGSGCQSSLIQGSDGLLYGTTNGGGTGGGSGTVFKVTTAGTLTTLVHFTGTTGAYLGNGPQAALVQGSDGLLYGTTNSGGTSGLGTVFKVTTAGTFSNLVSFTGATGAALGNGSQSALVQWATDGNFYGTTSGGGTSNSGTIFKVTPTGVFTTLRSFAFASTECYQPNAGLILGSDGNFWGTGFNGAASFRGGVFKLAPSPGTFTLVTSFPVVPATYKNLMLGSDGNFYGTTVNGGISGGTAANSVFKLTPGGVLSTLTSFASANSTPPYILQGNDGNLYGTTTSVSGSGTVFKLTTSGTLTTLNTFTGTSGAVPGTSPTGGIVQGSDGFLYGTTSSGGSSSAGTVFKTSTSGTFTSLATLTGATGANLGATPQTRLAQGSDGNFYGTTASGGAPASNGTVFRVTPAGVFTTLVNFTGTTGAAPGSSPNTNLLLASDGNLYGTTTGGGSSSAGTIFKIAPDGTFTSLLSFTNSSVPNLGSSPTSNLVQGSDGSLYGTTTAGGTSASGTVFKVTPSGALTTLVNFTGTSGAAPGSSPHGTLRQGSDGYFYGTTTGGGQFGLGTVFRVSPSGSFISLYAFGITNDGGSPNISGASLYPDSYRLVAGSDGYLYGVNASTVFRVHQQPAPQALAVTGLTSTGAMLAGSIVPNQDPGTVYYEYGLNTAYGTQTPVQTFGAGTSPIAVNATLTSLQAGAVYHVRMVIVTAQGTTFSADQTFATPAPPIAVTGSNTGAGQTGIALDGTVNPLGNTATCYFEYGTSRSYGTQTAVQHAGAGIVPVSVNTGINGLMPGSVYHVRLVASNSLGTTYGDDQVITTLPSGTNLVQPAFRYLATGTSPITGLVLGTDGYFYGVTNNGGTRNTGTAFKISQNGTMSTLASFNGGTNGVNPQGMLAQGTNGSFYGMTPSGGSYNLGTVFSVSPDGAFNTLASLNSITGSSPVSGFALGADGSLYGVCQGGGTSNSGTIFRMTPEGAITVLVNFTGTTGVALGSSPKASLILANDGNFYGTTAAGGTGGGNGTVFKMTPAGALTTLVNFTGTTGAALGSSPNSALIQGPDGNFYGTTNTGGTGGFGTVFVVTPAGNLTTLVNFTGTTGAALGTTPKGSLALGGDGSFYGTTQSGGTGGFGTVFKVTNGGVLTTLVNFTGTTGIAPGSSVQSGLALGNDGNFYGTTSTGGIYSQGTVFKVTPGGFLTTLVNFNTPPTVGKLAQGSDGSFYGTTLNGGGGLGYGTVFSGPVGGAMAMLAPLVPTSGTTALNSQGGFIQGFDGSLYGTSQSGGSSNLGSVFKITPEGALSTLINFTGTSGANLGSGSRAALTLGSDGNYWGTTNSGASLINTGSIFKMTPAGAQTTVVVFTGTTGANLGSNVQAPLVLGTDGNYYGTTGSGGTGGNFGTVFKMTPAGVLTTLANFTGTIGATPGNIPSGFLVQGGDGNFYGTTQGGGTNSAGTVYRVTPAGVFTSLASFTATTGALPGQTPTMGLVKGPDGYFYGTTTSGGALTFGTIFRVATDGSVTSVYSLTGGGEGITPTNGLTALADGTIYGVDSMVIYKFNPPPAALTAPATLVSANSATLNGSFTPEADAAAAYFEYGTSTAYGSTTAVQSFPAGYTASPLSAAVLVQPFLTYHFRAVGTNAVGSFPGADATFSTPNVATFNSAGDVPVTINGFTATGLPLNVVLGFAPSLGTKLTVVRNTGANPITGTFNGLPEGSTLTATFGAQTFLLQITYAGGNGNDITLTAVSQVITFPAIANKQTSDAAFTLGATATSGLPVSYAVVGGSSFATVTGSTVTLTGATGVVTVKATQPGNGAGIGAAPPVYQTFAVNNAAPFVQIVSSKGNTFALGIRTNGTLWGWGVNSNGQLGNGGVAAARVPTQIGSGTTWQSVAAGGNHAVAIRTDGTLWAWGLNTSGQLGDATTTQRTTPVQVGTATNWKLAVAGSTHTVAIKTDGTLWAWGGNSNGQLGQGTTDVTAHSTPTQVGTLTTWAQTPGSLTAGTDFTLAMKTDGIPWGWGLNSSGQLGDGTTTSPRSAPVQVGSGANWSTVAAGLAFSTGTKTDGTFWTWGLNSSGQLGDGTTTFRASPVQFTALANVQTIVPGGSHVLATKTDGTLWAWGSNSSSGQLGQNTADTTAHPVPTQVGTAANWQILAPGFTESFATRSDGSVWSWGSDGSGQLAYLPRLPLPVSPEFGPVSQASAGNLNSVAIKADGSLWAWGSNANGQLGLGATDSLPHATAVQLGAGAQWISASTGSSYTLAVRADGTLWAAGANGSGQLGDSTTTQRSSLVQVGVDNQWRTVSAASSHSLAIKADGTLWAWGLNGNGQLGDGTTTSRLAPVQVGTGTNWKTVIAGASGNFSIGIRTDGSLWAWGFNFNGQLGDGTTTQRLSPVQIGTSTWLAAACGNANTLAIRADGTLWGWGFNGSGQLGDGTTTQRLSPVQIGTDNRWTSVAANTATLATKSDGTLWAWGSGSNGQLGDGSFSATRLSPVQVGTSNGWSSVASLCISGHALAITADGTLWGVGISYLGQIGFAWRNPLVPDAVLPALSPAQTISFPPPASIPVGNTGILSATASSGLPVSYIVNGPATLDGDQLTVTSPGPITVIAYQPGDNYWQSSDIAFQYVNALPPAITAVSASAVTTTSATLNAIINPNATPTTAKFQSGLTNGYGTDTAITLTPNNGSTDQAVSTTLTGLLPGTMYHFRVTGTNAGGTTDTADITFTTISTDANLTALTPGAGTLSPVFASGTLAYTVSVANATTGITFTPVASNANELIEIRVNGAPYAAVTSGTASAALALNIGANAVDVRVTAQDTVTTKTYSVTVTRQTVFQDWAIANGVSTDPTANAGANVQSFAFGLPPGGGGALVFNGTLGAGGTIGNPGLPITWLEPVANGVDFRALFIRRKDAAAAGLTYTPQFSANLSTWANSPVVPTVLADDGTHQVVSVPYPPFVGGKKARFFRIGVTLAP